MKCFVCEAKLSCTNVLVRHIRVVHGYLDGKNLRLKCAQSGCGRVLGTFSGFRKHLNTKHTNNTDQQVSNVNSSRADLGNAEDLATANVEETATTSTQLKSNISIVDMCATAIAQLGAAGLSQSTVKRFVSSMEEVIFETHSQAMDVALQCLPSEDTQNKTKIEQSFRTLENPFTPLNSEAKLNKHLREKWGLVEPIEKVLGTRFDSRKNKSTGTYDQVTDRFAYIPILETLKSILQKKELPEMFKLGYIPKEGVYADLRDAIHFKESPLFSLQKDALQIQLFYDDFETANVLGPKKGLHKLGAIYFTLRNFSPIFNSSLLNIHLCALFHAQDIKRYSFNLILEPLVNDLKVLETEGLKIPTFEPVIYGTVVQVTGDNLGLHGLFGFVESFGARYCCRFCLLEKHSFQTIFSEDEHAQHCQTVQADPRLPHVYGVKRVCLLNSLQYFNTANNFSVDMMHDILKGGWSV
ncbi:uncharacterized protein LOC116729460 isoform X1 [Xiphophorus hellerii]|uniref:uncharacterized protein LOC116729460 isoform X1 n=1 Tax=Xiphophorus hellerii TaxID=8084 RepID=UPI0013B43F05|nr:uncharacterized protein LOC116729460 isoform X1 [Xiphophorus hellerii]XP_032433924.1 uncharacterized protein LOC116729460 isoform X1 [Xiphophorus hellerii]XP_032433925.1 uncharacterized protein LOC116729460 isoform X1 [Xiphophorus hellerii]